MVMLRTFVALAFITIGEASPIQPKSKAFTVHQIPRIHKDNTTKTHPNGPHAYARALKKYNAPAPDINIAVAAAAVVASGPVPATPPTNADTEYDSPVTIGSQTFMLDFDTGSSDTWVLGVKTGASSPHTLYSPGKTATLQTGQTWKIGYGDGSTASGTVYSDTMQIGKTIVQGQAIELANQASSAFTSASRPSDGLLGLAFDKLNTIKPTKGLTFFSNAINQGLPQKLFTVKLKKGAAGSYTFGAINPADYTGSITWTGVDSSKGFWWFQPTSYLIGSAYKVTPTSASVLAGIADTGTTLLLLDPTVVTQYWSQVTGATKSGTYGGYIFPCSSSLPNFAVMIGAYKAVVPGTYMNYARLSGGYCYGGIQSNAGIGFNIYGDIFLKSQFVVFDRTYSAPRLGFAAQS